MTYHFKKTERIYFDAKECNAINEVIVILSKLSAHMDDPDTFASFLAHYPFGELVRCSSYELRSMIALLQSLCENEATLEFEEENPDFEALL